MCRWSGVKNDWEKRGSKGGWNFLGSKGGRSAKLELPKVDLGNESITEITEIIETQESIETIKEGGDGINALT